MIVPLVHYCAWAQQPDIQIFCDGTYTQPGWGPQHKEEEEGPWTTDEKPSRLYAFEKGQVTCPACLEKLEQAPA